MVNVKHWVMRLVHSRSKSHRGLTLTASSLPSLVHLLHRYQWAVRIKVKAVFPPPGSSCHVCYAPGIEDSGAPLWILMSCIYRGLTVQKAHKQSSVVNCMITCDSSLPVLTEDVKNFFCFNVHIIKFTLFSGWSQSDHGDQSLAETCKFTGCDC